MWILGPGREASPTCRDGALRLTARDLLDVEPYHGGTIESQGGDNGRGVDVCGVDVGLVDGHAVEAGDGSS